jgi:hypothetical protein
MQFKLDAKLIESLQDYSKLLNKSVDVILKEALEDYFAKIQKEMIEKNMQEEYNLTNLSYDEFWDGFELDDE